MLIIAGEPSGDLHGEGVVRELLQEKPELQIWGIGGQRMAQAGQEQLYTTREMAIIGFSEVVRHLPFILRVMRELEDEVKRRRPDCAILIDYPGFNLRFARRLKKLGISVLYYIAPQVWAWGKGRVRKMVGLVDRMAVVFPFEEAIFRTAGIPTTFVGHPLMEGLVPELEEKQFLHRIAAVRGGKVLGLLPGSRGQEVERLLPRMLQTAAAVRERVEELTVVIARSRNLPDTLYDRIIMHGNVPGVHVLENATYAVMRYSTACLVASGTATLETACFQTPMVVVYRVSPLSYQIGKRLVKLERIGLVNIVGEGDIVPEFIQDRFQPERVAPVLLDILENETTALEYRERLADVREKLGTPGASKRVAKMALELT